MGSAGSIVSRPACTTAIQSGTAVIRSHTKSSSDWDCWDNEIPTTTRQQCSTPIDALDGLLTDATVAMPTEHRCSDCCERVLRLPNRKWTRKADELFFRQSFPSSKALLKRTMHSSKVRTSAYCCQCTWVTSRQVSISNDKRCPNKWYKSPSCSPAGSPSCLPQHKNHTASNVFKSLASVPFKNQMQHSKIKPCAQRSNPLASVVAGFVSAAIGSALKMTPAQRKLVSMAASQCMEQKIVTKPEVSKKLYGEGTRTGAPAKDTTARLSPTSTKAQPPKSPFSSPTAVAEWDDWNEQCEPTATLTAAGTTVVSVVSAAAAVSTPAASTAIAAEPVEDWDDWDEEATAPGLTCMESVPCQPTEIQSKSVAVDMVCSDVRCIKCSEKVIGMPRRQWADGAGVDYFYVRTHYPNVLIMAEKTQEAAGFVAFACQCNWRSLAASGRGSSTPGFVESAPLERSCSSWYVPK
jgi:hypothetical protein